MSIQNSKDREVPQPVDREIQPAARKPYLKPAFGHGRVFETLTLVCEKVQATQQQRNPIRRLSLR